MDLRELRSAIHRGDAEPWSAFAASGPWDGRLQLVGDALVMAVERREPGAEELARRCAEAARERGWEGDEELAEPDLAAILERDLDGKGAFRRFRDQLGRYPHLEQRWYVFSDERRRGLAVRPRDRRHEVDSSDPLTALPA